MTDVTQPRHSGPQAKWLARIAALVTVGLVCYPAGLALAVTAYLEGAYWGDGRSPSRTSVLAYLAGATALLVLPGIAGALLYRKRPWRVLLAMALPPMAVLCLIASQIEVFR
jgi:hypothetical protein